MPHHSTMAPSAYRRHMRKQKLASIVEMLADNLPALLPIGAIILLIVLTVGVVSHHRAAPAQKPMYSKEPADIDHVSTIERMVVSDDCDDRCYAHWRVNLQLVSICGDTYVQYDPIGHRKVIWLGKENDRYRTLSDDADMDKICAAEAK